MKILIDTNVFIPLEPTRPSEQEALTESTAKLHNLSITAGFQTYLHPAARIDLENDTDKDRQSLRKVLFDKYPALPDPPAVSPAIESVIGAAEIGSNDWVDHQLVAALSADAIDFLITEDIKLRKKVQKLGLGNRVFTITEAINLIEDLVEHIPKPPPAVRSIKAHALDPNDIIFESFKDDYPGFEEWFRKCRRQHRQAWVIDGKDKKMAGFCIVNQENEPPQKLNGKVLKLCSFKVSDKFNGFRYGELLLKAVFDHTTENQYQWIFVTVLKKHSKLIELLEDFGFSQLERKTHLGETILAKPLTPGVEKVDLEALPYHIRYGPKYFRKDVPCYMIPIQPKFANILFPETVNQAALFQGVYAFGNSIRKAYLCNSKTKALPEGAITLFYRSKENRGVIALGVVEETLRSSSSENIARAVGKRTVYSLEDINSLCQKPVLAILFRQAKAFASPIPVSRLLENRVFKRPPQSVMVLKGEGLTWIQQKIMM